MKTYLSLAIVFLFLGFGCVSKSICQQSVTVDKNEYWVLRNIEGKNRDFSFLFCCDEEWFCKGGWANTLLIDDYKSKTISKYSPPGIVSLENTRDGFYLEVFSPKGDYIVLPYGRFEGFLVLDNYKELTECILSGYPNDRCLKLFLEFNTEGYKHERSLWHTFKYWVNDDTFEFFVGLDDWEVSVRYEISTKKLLVSEPVKMPLRDILKATVGIQSLIIQTVPDGRRF